MEGGKRKHGGEVGNSEPKSKYQKVENPLRKSCPFLGAMNFKTFSPEKPFEPKLYKFPFDPLRYVIYKTTSLEKNYKHSLFTEPNLGINFDLINGAVKAGEKKKELDPEDIILLSEDTPEVQQLKKMTSSKVNWMKTSDPTVTISSYYQPKKVMVPPPKSPTSTSSSTRKAPQISNVEEAEKSFETVDDIEHPTKKAVRITPLLPNFDLIPNSYAQVYFDSAPVEEENKNAIITQTSLDSKILSYIIPKNDEELQTVGQVGDFELVREYQSVVNTDTDEGRLYFLTKSEDGQIGYVALNGKIKMERVRSNKTKKPSKITVELRELTDKEKEIQAEKLEEFLD